MMQQSEKQLFVFLKNEEFVKFIASGIRKLGSNAWIYREGKNREVYIVEFSKSLLNNFEIESLSDKTEYIRGYFDAEGGIAKSLKRQVLSLFCPEKSIRFTKGKKYIWKSWEQIAGLFIIRAKDRSKLLAILYSG